MPRERKQLGCGRFSAVKFYGSATTSRDATICVLDAAMRLLSRAAPVATEATEVSVDPLWLVFSSDDPLSPSGQLRWVLDGPLSGVVLEPAGARGTSALRLFTAGAHEPVARVELPPLLACSDLAELDAATLDEVLELYQGLVQVLDDRFDAVEAAIRLVGVEAESSS